jgi:hypothetical protein
MHATPTPRPRLALVAMALALVTVMSSCTIQPNTHMEVDFLGAKYRFYVYEKPSFLAVGLRDLCKAKHHTTSRKVWATCSLRSIRGAWTPPRAFATDARVFLGDDQWDDYGGAIDNVARGTARRDASGQYYVTRCLVGDHTAFREYNWTYRETGDAHCHRGAYPTDLKVRIQ